MYSEISTTRFAFAFRASKQLASAQLFAFTWRSCTKIAAFSLQDLPIVKFYDKWKSKICWEGPR